MFTAKKEAETIFAKRVMAFVTENPGAKLPVIERALGVSRIEVGRIIRQLMDQGKVRRDEDTREYFPL